MVGFGGARSGLVPGGARPKLDSSPSMFKLLRLAFTALLSSLACSANADDRIDCAPDAYIEAKSLAALPETIRVALADAPHKSHEISDAGGEFNAGDVGGGPYRRLAVEAIGANHVFVALEQGGIGYSVEVWAFTQGAQGWVGHMQTVVFKSPHSSNELVGIVCR